MLFSIAPNVKTLGEEADLKHKTFNYAENFI